MELVGKGLSVWTILREMHLIQKNGNNSIHRGIIRQLYFLPFVSCRIKNLNRYTRHLCTS